MPDLSDLKRGQIISARMVGPSVTKTAQIFGVLRGTVWKIWLHLQKKKKRKWSVHSKAQGWPKVEVVWETLSDFKIELFETTVELRRLELLLCSMNSFKIQCPQKLSIESWKRGHSKEELQFDSICFHR